MLEPEAVHTGMAAVPEGWAYKVLYIEPRLVHEWDERDAPAPRAARWVVFRDVALRPRCERAHAALVAEPPGDIAIEEAVLGAVAAPAPAPAARPARSRRASEPSTPPCAGRGAPARAVGSAGDAGANCRAWPA